MDAFRIDPPLVVKDTPKARRLASLAEARAFVEDAMQLGRPPPWRDVYYRLRAVRSADEAVEAIGALRELLELEDLLVHPKMSVEPQR
jgi:DNA topoisomerase VI subunit A